MRCFVNSTLLVIVTLSTQAIAADRAAAPKFTKTIPTDAVRFVVSTSPDDQARTMMFDNFLITTDSGKPVEPDVRMKTFSFEFGVESESDACVHLYFQGFVARQGSSSTAMIVHAGGKTTVVDLKQSIAEANKDVVTRNEPTRAQAKAAAADEGFDDSKPDGEFDDFLAHVSTLAPKGESSLLVTVILLVDRVKGAAIPEAYLSIDTIDAEVLPDVKPSK